MFKKCPVCGKSHLNVWGLIMGGFFTGWSILTHWGRQFRVGRGGEYITPETHPRAYWVTIIGIALLGLGFIAFTLISFFRDRHHEKS